MTNRLGLTLLWIEDVFSNTVAMLGIFTTQYLLDHLVDTGFAERRGNGKGFHTHYEYRRIQ